MSGTIGEGDRGGCGSGSRGRFLPRDGKRGANLGDALSSGLASKCSLMLASMSFMLTSTSRRPRAQQTFRSEVFCMLAREVVNDMLSPSRIRWCWICRSASSRACSRASFSASFSCRNASCASYFSLPSADVMNSASPAEEVCQGTATCLCHSDLSMGICLLMR